MSYKVEALPDSYAELGEGPHWDVATQSLYFVDINYGTLLRYDYQANIVYRCRIDKEDLVGFIVPIEGTTDKFAVGCRRRVLIVTWNGIADTCQIDGELFNVQRDAKFTDNRFNDAKCDPLGRLFAGTMRHDVDIFKFRAGELYKYEKGGKVDVVKSDICISNGLAWNAKGNKFYYNDTGDFEVKEYDYDLERGVASNPKVVYDMRNSNAVQPWDNLLPDGMTIDIEGNLYVAVFNGGRVQKINPNTGALLLEIKLPCKQITSVAFGGPNLDILFVTSSSLNNEPTPAGNTFKVTGLGAKGLPMTKLRI